MRESVTHAPAPRRALVGSFFLLLVLLFFSSSSSSVSNTFVARNDRSDKRRPTLWQLVRCPGLAWKAVAVNQGRPASAYRSANTLLRATVVSNLSLLPTTTTFSRQPLAARSIR